MPKIPDNSSITVSTTTKPPADQRGADGFRKTVSRTYAVDASHTSDTTVSTQAKPLAGNHAENGFRKTGRPSGQPVTSPPATVPAPAGNDAGQSPYLSGSGSTAGALAAHTTEATGSTGSTGSAACSTPVTQRIIGMLTQGRTIRMVADELGLPMDFVNLVVDRERHAGRLDVYDLRSCNSTTGEGCDPDPDSLVCAGCPILPAAIRRRQSVIGRLATRLRGER
ncbi:hypothetical protein PT282_00295 [Bifidobacterium sp. ESL0763]|uniref:hypothetical protein n=1 Tax=Bifidobacterium sp. ESL0763 TaxID=2983227 RepID=UPI0023F874AB|nr:hypothetical protein [Bifidobacterium sp. ESL0763]MDF7663124.1 hypothetical protein [Bifidobacterium sp. ESL0763]